jgi:hypothetical protein
MALSRWHRVPHDAKGSTPSADESEKKFPKPLDKLYRVWYNKNTERGKNLSKKERN